MPAAALVWTPAPGAASVVYRSEIAGQKGQCVAKTANANFVDTGVADGKTYYYSVAGENAGGEGPATAQVPLVVPTAPPQAQYIPPAPSLVNRFGTWTLVDNKVLLNGAATNATGIRLELAGGDIFVWNGTFWQQYFDADWCGGKGFGPLNLLGTTDPADVIYAPALPYVGPSNTPDVWQLELTDWAAIEAHCGHAINHAINPNGAEFLIDAATGIRYLRFTNDPRYYDTTYDGTVLLSWFLQLGASYTAGRQACHLRWLQWFEDDVVAGMDEVAFKLPGLTNDQPFGGPVGTSVKWRNTHGFPMGGTFIAGSLPEAAENFVPGSPWEGGGGGAPIVYDRDANGHLISYKPGRWYAVEQALRLNDIGKANGYGALWLNGHKVLERSDVLWRTDAATQLVSAFVNFYHGGLNSPNSLMHYRLAKIAVSSSYIGVPAELLGGQTPGPTPTPTYPAWRKSTWAKYSVQPIPGTAKMAGDVPESSPQVYPTTVGKNPADIITWNGFAADEDGFWLVALGGHNAQWSNKVVRFKVTADAPRYLMEYRGSDPAPLPYNHVTGTPPIPSADAANTMYHYADGLPAARHTYYANVFIGKRKRVIMFYCIANYGSSPNASADVDAYDITAKRYDPAKTWASHGYALGFRPTVAKHPVTEDVYLGTSLGLQKWTEATATWSAFTPTGSVYRMDSRGTLIDPTRNRWMAFAGGIMQAMDLSTRVVIQRAITDPSGQFAADAALDQYGALSCVHDTDNDKYMIFFGLHDGANLVAPGRLYAIDPATAAATLVADIPAPVNALYTRVAHFPKLGGIVFVPDYDNDALFIPTR